MTEIRLDTANPYRPLDRSHPPVRVETMLFSVVEPDPGQAVAYNDWYERDHQFDGGMSGAGWFSNRRWVAPRRLKALRFPEDGAFPRLDIGSLAQVYWRRQGHAQMSERWALDQWVALNAQHRIFTARRHFHSASYWHLSTATHPGERVPLELALQHPFAGLVVLAIDDACAGGRGDRAAMIAAIEAVAAGHLLAADLPILSSWEILRQPGAPAVRPPGSIMTGEIDRLFQLAFLRDDPETLWPRIRTYAGAIGRETSARVSFVSGFVPTIPGTIAHLDEI